MDFPCHTQAVERMIGLVTQIAEKFRVTGEHPVGQRFEQEVSNVLFSRLVMAYFKSKQDYRPHRVRRYTI